MNPESSLGTFRKSSIKTDEIKETTMEKFEREFIANKREFSITDWSVFKRNLFLEILQKEQKYEQKIKERIEERMTTCKKCNFYQKECDKLQCCQNGIIVKEMEALLQGKDLKGD
jgi:hypothetical protein